MFSALVLVSVNFLVDLLYAVLDRASNLPY